MKNKFLVLTVISISLFMVACSSESKEIIKIDNGNEVVKELAVKEKSRKDEANINASTDEIDTNASIYEMETITLKDELARDYNKLTEVQIEKLSAIYDKIASFEFSDDNDDEYNELWYDFNSELISMGIDVPFNSYIELAYEYENVLSERDYNRIIMIDEKMLLSGDNEVSDEEYNKLNDELVMIFDKYKLPGKEIKTQVEMGNVQLALFEVKYGEITLSKSSVKKDISKDEMELYQKFWKHVKTIVPSSYVDMLTKFEINTDGFGNVMAHVVEEETDLSIWRLAVDLKDSANANGEFTSEFNNTVIHEFAHVMTLNKSQMQMDEITDKNTFEVQEGILKKQSYLNRFYDKFWKEIYKEHQKASDEDYENAMPSGGDAVFAFYEKYEDRFVTDYAATNPGEDIAESYRVFVVEKKPTGNTIKDKKILFFYEVKDFVKIREEIRRNLGL